jgi:TatD DNase family protein
VSIFVDTHCHVESYARPLAVLEAAADSNVVTVAVTALPSEFERLDLELPRLRNLRLALGLHPLRINEANEMELRLFERLLERTDYVGEVGLDFSQLGRATRLRQIEVFERILRSAAIQTKVLTVHARGAEEESIERLAQVKARAILHWYTGPLKHVDAALAAGLYFSVNPAMLVSRSGQRLLAALPPERVLCETDGPFTEIDGRPAEPRDVPRIVDALGRRWGVTTAEARERIFENLVVLRTGI